MISEERVLHRAAVLLAAVCLFACGERSVPHRRDGRPNVLVVVMDTARADHFSSYGYSRKTTPRIDGFAKGAVTFLDAWSPAGWTGPAHASLFTGLRPIHHGYLLGNQSWLGQEATTLAELLRTAGYRTACLTNNVQVSPEFGLAQGFDTYESVLGHKDPDNVPSRWAFRRAVEIAQAGRDAHQPFFVFVNAMEPHLRYDPPERWAAPFLPKGVPERLVTAARRFNFPLTVEVDFGDRRLSDQDFELLGALYDGELAGLDDLVGETLDELKHDGILDDTLVILTADHGEHLGEHGLTDHKQSLYRAICHVPLIVRLPGLFDGGRREGAVVRLEDVFPTVLEAVGVAVPPGLDGRSLAGDLSGRISRGEHGEPEEEMLKTTRRYLSAKQVDAMRFSLRSVYDGRYHLIRWTDGREELYDVTKDPREAANLLSGRPDVAARLRAELDP